MLLVTLLLVALVILALALFPLGLRGRRVDDHPLCRRCGFDLFGAPAGSSACPECGADLSRPRATRTGNRVRRAGLRAGALGALALALAAVSGTSWVSMRGTDLTPYKPAWLVMREVSGPEAISRPALRELSRRLAAGSLSDEEVDAFADRALALQADRTQRWLPAWGTFLEAAYDAGRLDADRWDRYLRQSVELRMMLRPRIRRGDPLPVAAYVDRVRVGDERRFTVSYGRIAPLSVSGVPLARDDGTGTPGVLNGVGVDQYFAVLRPDPTALAQLADGELVARGDVNVAITDVKHLSAPPVHFVARPEVRFTLLPADQPSVTPIEEPDLADRLRRAFDARLIVDPRGPGTLSLDMVGDVPASLGFDVLVRAAGREWPMGRFAIWQGSFKTSPERTNVSYVNPGALPGLTAASVDIVLRSNPSASLESIYMTEVWDGEVVFEDVVVHRIDPVTGLLTPPLTADAP
jgi:hypothetical protein